jgi:hypothetical protein
MDNQTNTTNQDDKSITLTVKIQIPCRQDSIIAFACQGHSRGKWYIECLYYDPNAPKDKIGVCSFCVSDDTGDAFYQYVKSSGGFSLLSSTKKESLSPSFSALCIGKYTESGARVIVTKGFDKYHWKHDSTSSSTTTTHTHNIFIYNDTDAENYNSRICIARGITAKGPRFRQILSLLKKSGLPDAELDSIKINLML